MAARAAAEVPSGMAAEAALLEAFTSIPQLAKATCRPYGEAGVQLQVCWLGSHCCSQMPTQYLQTYPNCFSSMASCTWHVHVSLCQLGPHLSCNTPGRHTSH